MKKKEQRTKKAYDIFTCRKICENINFSLEEIMKELDEYAPEFLMYCLARQGVDYEPNIVDGTYTSVWEGEGEITAKAKININTGEVTILESFDPADCYNEDGEPFECEHLSGEYVTINGTDYPCHREEDEEYWNKIDGWTPNNGFWYE